MRLIDPDDQGAAARFVLRFHDATTLRHGACKGVDTWAGRVGSRLGLRVEEMPADWARHGRAAGPMRNAALLEGADAVVALPGGRGTLDTVTRARRRGIPVTSVGGTP